MGNKFEFYLIFKRNIGKLVMSFIVKPRAAVFGPVVPAVPIGTEDCCICLEKIKSPTWETREGTPLEPSFIAKCGHVFHLNCALKIPNVVTRKCPLCRHSSFSELDNYSESAEEVEHQHPARNVSEAMIWAMFHHLSCTKKTGVKVIFDVLFEKTRSSVRDQKMGNVYDRYHSDKKWNDFSENLKSASDRIKSWKRTSRALDNVSKIAKPLPRAWVKLTVQCAESYTIIVSKHEDDQNFTLPPPMYDEAEVREDIRNRFFIGNLNEQKSRDDFFTLMDAILWSFGGKVEVKQDLFLIYDREVNYHLQNKNLISGRYDLLRAWIASSYMKFRNLSSGSSWIDDAINRIRNFVGE